MEILQFTEDHKAIALFKVASENNALLRMLLFNQHRIMEHLKLSFDVVTPFTDLSPEETPELNEFQQLDKRMHELTMSVTARAGEAIIQRSLEWAQQNLKS